MSGTRWCADVQCVSNTAVGLYDAEAGVPVTLRIPAAPAPAVPEPAAPGVVAPPAAPPTTDLPHTGLELTLLIALAVVLIVMGALLVTRTTRPRSTR